MTGFAVVSSRSSVRLYRDQRWWRIFFTLIRFSVLAGRLAHTSVDPMPPVGGIESHRTECGEGKDLNLMKSRLCYMYSLTSLETSFAGHAPS